MMHLRQNTRGAYLIACASSPLQLNFASSKLEMIFETAGIIKVNIALALESQSPLLCCSLPAPLSCTTLLCILRAWRVREFAFSPSTTSFSEQIMQRFSLLFCFSAISNERVMKTL